MKAMRRSKDSIRLIARFFREIGYADELGSGVRNLFRYTSDYTPGATPQLIEGDVFKQIIPIRPIGAALAAHSGGWEEVRSKFGERFGEKVNETEMKILEMISEKQNITIPELAGKLHKTPRTIEKSIAKLRNKNILERVGPAKGGHWKITTD